MDEQTLKAEIETFFVKANIGNSDKKKLTKRLPESISFLLSIGVELDDIPKETQIEQLEGFLDTLTYRKGKNGEEKHYAPGVIRDWVNRTKDFYYVRNGNSSDKNPSHETQIAIPELEAVNQAITENTKGDTHMTTPENQTINSAVSADPEQPPQTEAEQPEALSPVDDIRKPGRPISTNRSAKFTLYMTPALWKNITILADLDEISITDLMNEALEYYCTNSRKDDLEFLYGLELKKQERRRLKAKR